MSHAEEPDRYMAVLADFLSRAEQGLVATRATGAGAPRAAPAAAQRRARPALRSPRA